MKSIVSILLLFMSSFAIANTDYRALLLQAMHDKNGTAESDISGPVADMIRAKINRPNARVLAQVTTVATLPTEGCKRLRVRLTTPGTLLPMTDGSSRALDMSMDLNMCPNGIPPGPESNQPPMKNAPPTQAH